jgi:ribosomal-protein-alanine N-acetyltransferase
MRGATRVYLEVDGGNAPAIALYAAAGWARLGTRRGYYGGSDALVMGRDL